MMIAVRDWRKLGKEVIAEAGYPSVELWAAFCPNKIGAVVFFQFNEGTEHMAFEIRVQVGSDSDMKEELRQKLAAQMKNRVH